MTLNGGKIKIELELSEKQYSVLVNALEDYARIMLGQFWALDMPYYERNQVHGGHDAFKEKLDELKLIAFPELSLHEYYGISHEKTPEASKIAYEIYKTMRHEVWKQSNRNEHTVDATGALEVRDEKQPEVRVTL